VPARASVRPAFRTVHRTETERVVTPKSASAPAASPRQLTALVCAVIASGVAIVAHACVTIANAPMPMGFVAFGVLAIVAASFALKMPGVPVYLSISDVFFLASVLLFGPSPATLTIAVDSFLVSWRRRNNWTQTLYNTFSCTLALWCGAQVYFLLSPTGPMAGSAGRPDASTILPLAVFTAVYFALNSTLMAAAVALSKGLSVWRLWRQFSAISLNHFASASAAFLLILMIRSMGYAAFVIALPLVLVCYFAMRSWIGRVDDAQRHVKRVNELYLSTISALSTAIEAKDGVTSDHIHRVQAYALGLAHELGVRDENTLQAIEAAALLHDTGKLAIPEHILNKPGKLTPSEFETMKTHVNVGADILSSIDFPYPVVPIVRAHHENWDGTGYPDNVCGEDIPIGARILSVVDCFDALTSDRPYRPAMTAEDALEIIRQRRGSMYDPHVVDTFVRVHKQIAPTALPEPQLHDAVGRISRAHSTAASQPADAAAALTATVAPEHASEEVVAFVSLARLAAQTPEVGDVGALAWATLRHLLQGASLALFTLDGDGRSVTGQYAAGPAATRLRGLTIEIGQRLTGWAAATQRTLNNSDARLDLVNDPTETLRFALAVPLVHHGTLVGVMTLYAHDTFADDLSQLLGTIAPHLAASLVVASRAVRNDRAAA
jgi:putative nucleotidyltransferase with HDIG domain